MISYYEILEIEKEASEEEIARAYRDLSKQYHPDKFPENSNLNVLKIKKDLSEVERDQLTQLEKKAKEYEERFKKIKEAHAVLSNPEKREMYDKEKKNDKCSSSGDDWFTEWNRNWNIKFQKHIENDLREKKRQYKVVKEHVSSNSNLKEQNQKKELRRALKQKSLHRICRDICKESDLNTIIHIPHPEKLSAWLEDINFSNYSEYIEAYVILYDEAKSLDFSIKKGVELSSTFLHEAIECGATKVVYYLSNEYIDKIDINY